MNNPIRLMKRFHAGGLYNRGVITLEELRIMAKTPKTTDEIQNGGQADTLPTVLEPITALSPAAVIGMSTRIEIPQALLPEEFQGQELEVIETGFDPTVKWVNPGNFVAGVYEGFKEGIGPNKSRLYQFTAKGKPFGVWGTTVLDRAFDAALESKQISPGRKVMITYVGSVETDKQPCKIFHIAVAKVKTV
jgi:hypothetical protein